MTKEKLNQYVSLKKEIASLQRKLDRLYDKEVPIVAGAVMASSREHPYTEIRVGVEMYEPAKADVINRLIRAKKDRRERVEKLMLEIEDFISSISDSELRVIFEMRFLDGKKQMEIARELNIDQSRVSRKIDDYLKDA